MAKGQNVEFLYKKYMEFNSKYFGNILSKSVIISVSKRLTRRAGACYFYVYPNNVIRPVEICISQRYIEKYPHKIDFVLLHEMIHIKLGNTNHGVEFLNELNHLNTTYDLDIEVIGETLQYFYRCAKCGKSFSLNEKLNILLYCCNVCHSELIELSELKGEV